MEASRVEQFLKQNSRGSDVVAALWRRLEIHLTEPKSDNLSRRVWRAYNKLPELIEEPFSILDAGCMSGFLYHFLKRKFKDFTYTGLDCWSEALQVGRSAAPETTFICGDILSCEVEPHDYVWCCNLPWRNGQEALAVKHLYPLAKKALFFVTIPGNGSPWKYYTEGEIIDCGESTMVKYGH